MRGQFLLDAIEATKVQILLLQDATIALTNGSILSYSIDTGQTKQSVTKADISRLNSMIDSLYNRLATLEARAGCGGTVYARPAF